MKRYKAVKQGPWYVLMNPESGEYLAKETLFEGSPIDTLFDPDIIKFPMRDCAMQASCEISARGTFDRRLAR